MTVPTSNTARIMRKRFGSWLKEAREATGLTQLDVATILDYAYHTTVSQIERGVSALPPAEIALYAEAIRVNPKKLAETYLYYIEPYVYAAIYGKDPYVLENLPRPDTTIRRREARVVKVSADTNS